MTHCHFVFQHWHIKNGDLSDFLLQIPLSQHKYLQYTPTMPFQHSSLPPTTNNITIYYIIPSTCQGFTFLSIFQPRELLCWPPFLQKHNKFLLLTFSFSPTTPYINKINNYNTITNWYNFFHHSTKGGWYILIREHFFNLIYSACLHCTGMPFTPLLYLYTNRLIYHFDVLLKPYIHLHWLILQQLFITPTILNYWSIYNLVSDWFYIDIWSIDHIIIKIST